MSVQQVHSVGIYHGLPVYPEELCGLTAIITGANGISGHYMVRVLSQDTKRWKKIICLSRRPPLVSGGLPDHVEHIPLDFLKQPSEIANVLEERKAAADHVFFFSYIQPPPKPGASGIWSDAEELVRVNSLLLSNFVEALKLADIRPKRFMLQTGAKNYGGHLGPTKVPQEEIDARVTIEPNFYYPQEDIVSKYCQETGCGWSICMPGPILGAVPDAAMNAAFPLAVYCAVCKKLGQPLDYPGDIDSWQMTQSMSSSMINAYMEEWSVLLGPPNQKYNTCDSSAFAWVRILMVAPLEAQRAIPHHMVQPIAMGLVSYWRFSPDLRQSETPDKKCWLGTISVRKVELCGAVLPPIPYQKSLYGIESRGPQDGDHYQETVTPYVPRGYGPKGVTRRKFRLLEWAKKDEVKRAWSELAEEHGLTQKELLDIDRVFGFTDGTLCRPGPLNFSMDKSRKLGWHGFVDSTESLLEVFKDLAKLKMIPPVPMVKVSFN